MMTEVLSGAIVMAYATAGLFFLRFWKRTADTLFLLFGIAFWLLGVMQVLVVSLDVPREELSWVYVLRLVAFSLIVIAIAQKNMKARKVTTDSRDGR